MDATVRHGIEAKVYAGRRLDRAEGLALSDADDLLWLGRLAHRRRCAVGDDRVWFALDESRRDASTAPAARVLPDGVAELRYGHGHRERPAELVDQMLSLRDAPHAVDAVVVVRQAGPDGDGPAPVDSLRVFAVTRLLLDEVAHVRCDLGTHGDAVAQFGLQFGVDDLGDPAGDDERRAALVDLIRDAGFRPVRRDAGYRVLGQWDAAPPLAERRAEPQRIWA